MKSTFNRNQVIKELKKIPKLATATISDGKGHSVTIATGSTGLFVYASNPQMSPKSLGEMADLICRSSQTA